MLPSGKPSEKISAFILDIVQKVCEGGGQKFEVVLFPLFDPLSDIKWGEGGGFDHMPTVLRHFLPKYWVNI